MTRHRRQAGRDLAWERRMSGEARRLPPPRWTSRRPSGREFWAWMAFMSALGKPPARNGRRTRVMVL